MVVFLSDFLEAEKILPERLRFALSSRYDALCLQVLDREEETLPKEMPCDLLKWKAPVRFQLQFEVIRSEFGKQMAEFKEILARNLAGVSAEFESLLTDQILAMPCGVF